MPASFSERLAAPVAESRDVPRFAARVHTDHDRTSLYKEITDKIISISRFANVRGELTSPYVPIWKGRSDWLRLARG